MQSYQVVNNTQLEPRTDFSATSGHPLVETTSAASVNGAAQILLRTEFVGIGAFWKQYASGAGDYLAGHDPAASLAVLGYTGGAPLIWFANVPTKLRTPSSAFASCLVFYRPANDTYTRLDQAHDMGRLNRYLLSQVPGSTDYTTSELFMPYPARKGDPPLYGYLRCGFERALVQSKKPVVMLHPWPNGEDYGQARGGQLPMLAAWAVRFLWASGLIDAAGSQSAVRLGRLGLAGFSAGGQAMWPTLAAVADRIEEVYSFDANGLLPTAALQWFGGSPTTRCLRMTGAYQIAAHQALKNAIESKSGATRRVTAWPASAAAYDAGGTPAWDQALSGLPTSPQNWQNAVRGNVGYRHQFAVFGGSGAVSSSTYTSFLQEFLQGSDF
jgi:hypothetical protein